MFGFLFQSVFEADVKDDAKRRTMIEKASVKSCISTFTNNKYFFSRSIMSKLKKPRKPSGTCIEE